MKFLIVVDLQNDFFTGSLGTKEAEAILPKVLEKIRAYRPKQIFVTQDSHPDNYLETKEGCHLPPAHMQPKILVRDLEHFQIPPLFSHRFRIAQGFVGYKAFATSRLFNEEFYTAASP